MASPDSPPRQFRFPKVMKRLAYAKELLPGDYECFERDGERLLRDYWAEMYRAVRYENFVHSPGNCQSPNILLSANLSNATDLGARGFSYFALSGLLGSPLDDLEKIPPDADAFVTTEFDRVAAGLFARLCMVSGVKAANATKILYQKRPRLYPILDQYARRALNVPYIGGYERGDCEQLLLLALQRVRDIASVGPNAATLAHLESVSSNVTGGIRLSRVRVIDILAWMAVGQGRQ